MFNTVFPHLNHKIQLVLCMNLLKHYCLSLPLHVTGVVISLIVPSCVSPTGCCRSMLLFNGRHWKWRPGSSGIPALYCLFILPSSMSWSIRFPPLRPDLYSPRSSRGRRGLAPYRNPMISLLVVGVSFPLRSEATGHHSYLLSKAIILACVSMCV